MLNDRIQIRYNSLIFVILLLTISCQSPAKKVEKETVKEVVKETENFSFQIGDKAMDLNYIKKGCNIVNSIRDQIPDDFIYSNFFYYYLQFKSYKSEYLKYFDCAYRLEIEGSFY